MIKRRSAIVLLIVVACLGADTQPALHFLKPDSIDVIALLPDPPPARSHEDQCELQQVLDQQESRTPDEVGRARSEEKLSIFAFNNVLGDWFTEKNCPKTAALFNDIESDSKFFSNSAKAHFNRARPYVADSRVKSIFPTETEGSYPSGHATRGMLYALLLAEIFPDQREQLIARGQQIGWDRVIAGVHYESDLLAGRVLGKAIFKQLLASEEFRKRLNEVKRELLTAQRATLSAPASNSIPQ